MGAMVPSHMGSPTGWAGDVHSLPSGAACIPPYAPLTVPVSRAPESLGVMTGFPLYEGKRHGSETCISRAVKPEQVWHWYDQEPEGIPAKMYFVIIPSFGPVCGTIVLFPSCLQNLRLRKHERERLRKSGVRTHSWYQLLPSILNCRPNQTAVPEIKD